MSKEKNNETKNTKSRIRNEMKRKGKKQYEFDDNSDIIAEFKGKKSDCLKSNSNKKSSIDLSKYKDEYKDIIQNIQSDEEIKANLNQTSKQTPKDNKMPIKQTNSMDAFQIMMDARKKSIGMNSPGKELVEDEPQNSSARKEVKAKRFLALSILAEEKGASKNKELEQLRDESIKKTLNKRADSFKKMLQQGNKKKVTKTSPDKLKEGMKDYEEIFVKKENKKKRNRDTSNLCENDNEPVKKSKIQNKSSQDNKICDNNQSLIVTRKLNKALKDDQEDNFVKMLSPSIKKSESVLCYFEKTVPVESPVDNSSIEKNVSESDEELNELIKVQFKTKTKKSRNKLLRTTRKSQRKVKSIENVEKHEERNVMNNVIQSISNDSQDLHDVTEKNEDLEKKSISTPPKDLRRPQRIIKKPVKYTQVSSEESSDSDEDMFEIKKSNKKGIRKKNMNKENVLTIEIDDKVSPLKIINLQSPGQMKCIRSPRTTKPCDLPNDKLAPLFRKSLPKPKVDPTVMEARRLFLQSGIPEAMKKQFEKTVAAVSQIEEEFKNVCHIQQRSDEDIWNLPLPKFMLDISDAVNDVKNCIRCFDASFILKESNTTFGIKIIDQFNKLETFDLKQGLRELKQANLNFPIYKTFQQLWDKYSNTTTKSSSQDSGVFIENSSCTDTNCNNGVVWTEKYKPSSSHDIIGNFQALHSIKKWLESWKEFNEMSANKVPRKTRRPSSSSSDFDMSDSESKDSTRTPSNVMIITGPMGSGKTSAIYALANELGINVLEVNSSSRRTGKRILTHMHEATQSHKVLTKQNSESSFSGVFSKSNNETISKTESKLLNETKKTGSKGKLKKEEIDSNEIGLESQKNPDVNIMSLMLIDDVDIVFEEDDGFISALSQIIQSSKRPVILVATDGNSSHLQRFKLDSNIVKFNPLSGKILGPWLDVLILIECNKIIPKLSANLLESNKGDMRKCLLQLQYWISGNKNVDNKGSTHFIGEGLSDDESNVSWMKSDCSNITITPDFESLNLKKSLLAELSSNCNLESIWWYLDSLLKNIPSIIESEETCQGVENSAKRKVSLESLESLYEYIDMYSVIDLMQSHSQCNNDNIAVPPWQKSLKDGLSESENMLMYNNHANISNAWCQYIHKHSSRYIKDLHCGIRIDDVTHIESLDIRAYERRLKIYNDFSQGISLGSQLDRSSMFMDYMPTLRCIGRSEKLRSSNNYKRNNRFHNYLNTLSISCNDITLKNACKIFTDS